MIYFNSDKLNDALLETLVTQEIIDESSRYIENFALTLGVRVDQIKLPPNYMISRLAESYCYMIAALRKAKFSTGKDVDQDAFALKYTLYKSIVNTLEDQITAETFTGGSSAKKRRYPLSVKVYRS